MDQELTGNAFKRFMRRRGLSKEKGEDDSETMLDSSDRPSSPQFDANYNQLTHRASSTFVRTRDPPVRSSTPVSPHHDNVRRTQSTCETAAPQSPPRRQRRQDEDPNRRQYRCEYCPLTFGRKHHKERHVANIHRHEKPYVCDICGHPFHQKPNLDRHRSTVHAESSHFRCDECGLSFPRRSALRSHIQSTHDRSRRHECSACRATFSTVRELSDHVRIEHSSPVTHHQ